VTLQYSNCCYEVIANKCIVLYTYIFPFSALKYAYLLFLIVPLTDFMQTI